MSECSTKDLLTHAVNDGGSAWNPFFVHLYPDLTAQAERIAVRLDIPRDDALDAVQDLFTDVLEKPELSAALALPMTNARALLCGAIRNKLVDRYRTRARESRSAAQVVDLNAVASHCAVAPRPRDSVRIQNRLDWGWFIAKLKRVLPAKRFALFMRAVADGGRDDMAQASAIGAKRDTVRSLWKRIRDAARKDPSLSAFLAHHIGRKR